MAPHVQAKPVGQSQTAQKQAAESPKQAPNAIVHINQILAEDEQAQLEEEQDEGLEDTEPEKPLNEPWAIQNKLRNLERGRKRKQARLEKEEKAIQEQKDYIAEQQGKLVELQAKADSTTEQIRSIDSAYAENTELLARVAAERSATEAAANPKQEQRRDNAQEAKDLLTTALLGLQTYRDQPPEIQVVLTQFVGFIKAMQCAEVDKQMQPQPGQITLQQAFAKIQPPPTSSSSSAQPATSDAVQFAIHSGEATPKDSGDLSNKSPPEQGTDMWVDTKAAQERKVDEAASSAQSSTEPENIKPQALEQADAQQPLQHSLGTPLAPLGAPVAQYRPASREALLADLRAQADKDAIRAGKKERDLQYSRASPY